MYGRRLATGSLCPSARRLWSSAALAARFCIYLSIYLRFGTSAARAGKRAVGAGACSGCHDSIHTSAPLARTPALVPRWPALALAAGRTALAAELHRRGHHVALITDKRGAEIPGKPDFLPAHVIPAGRFGKNPLSWFKGLKAVWEGRRMALRLFDSFQPSAVVGFGGYPSLPAILAATSAGVPTVDDIISLVTEHYQVKLSELQSKKRTKAIAFPRQVAMYLSRKVTRHSLEEVGGFFGGRDHTTVLYAVEKIEKEIAADREFSRRIQHFLDRLGSGGRS